MTNPFGTSLRRDPADPRGLQERIEAVLLERLEEAVDTACLGLLVETRRERNLPPPVADSAEDRAEFEGLVVALLRLLEASITAGPSADNRSRLAPAPTGAREEATLLAIQVSLARRLPDYWQRFEAVKDAFAAGRNRGPRARGGLLGRRFGKV